MPIPSYRLLAFEQPVGRGVTGARYVGVSGVAKLHRPDRYTVANEWVASEIGRMLRIPVPPSFLTAAEDGDRYFVSLDFSLAREVLPPVSPAAVVERQPQVAARLIAFDALIANSDRHPGNLALHPDTGQLMVYDHSHAVFGPGPVGTGRPFLEVVREELGILGGRGTRHCLANEVKRPADLRDGAQRVAALDSTLLAEIAQETKDLGAPVDEADFLADYLVERCGRIADLFERALKQFPQVQQEDLL